MPRTPHGPLTAITDTIDDRTLAKNVHFAPDSGHILLFGQRMLLMHGASVATLRHELVERLGLERTRELFTRIGYQQGVDDARCLREAEGGDLTRTLALGPRLREIEGFVRNQAVERMQFNTDSGEFWGDYYWQASWEAEAHLKHFGISGSPACWMMTGYASGFTTTMMGRPILWRELECVAMGHARCRVIGRPLEECEDSADDLSFLRIEDFVSAPRGRHAPVDTAATASLPDLVGASAGFNAVAHLIRRVAPTDATVLLLGESGVGKERFSKTLHAIGPRAKGPFVGVNCAAIPAELVEAELFGVERGAFTGAHASRPGKFERAHGGTLFLDEISSLPMPAQGKLLRALQEGEVERVGDTRVRPVDVRIVAAANRDLRAEVAAGRFREDLFFRLNVFPIEIPPLRERREDIPLMLNVFVERYAKRFGKHIAGLTQRAAEALWAYDWPGNVRELENIVERAVILADDGGNLDVQHLFSGGERLTQPMFNLSAGGRLTRAAETTTSPSDAPSDGVDAHIASLVDAGLRFDELEQRLLDHAMTRTGGNLSAAARLLGLRRGQFEYRAKKREAGSA
ncbi:MAG: sigma 54-interacting transcriptional regulator [Methyloversatilis discipulorum]|uniref:sigma-54-dependent Fis family transcriptional regulator n=1 Tax=Methyloversatilis discipulorum TaxID=1119528 RepID=UPI0026F2F9FB|nr:sigma-54-dependent Fis family transcriptional regulator [Methyloversatilis discipulorum]MBT9517801.1 sigma 54-interacting transcriptional regulator [Methyloversatilis discipulorum]